eukprot:9369916-Alexandrium_andersonii.AAC.1
MVLYVDNLISPAIALALGRGSVKALADAEPDAVARYAPDLLLASSAAARRRVPFAISMGNKARHAFNVVGGGSIGAQEEGPSTV